MFFLMALTLCVSRVLWRRKTKEKTSWSLIIRIVDLSMQTSTFAENEKMHKSLFPFLNGQGKAWNLHAGI